MKNREFRDELRMMWLFGYSNAGRKDEQEVKIVTTSDMIRLTAMFTCACLILMAAAIAVVAVPA